MLDPSPNSSPELCHHTHVLTTGSMNGSAWPSVARGRLRPMAVRIPCAPSESAELFGDFDQHRAGPVVYYTHAFDAAGPSARTDAAEDEEKSLAIGLGWLAGLNGNTADHTLKLSIEVQF